MTERIYPEQLGAFYHNYFPSEDLIRWLSYEGVESKDYLRKREISYAKEEAVVRHKSVSSVTEFKSSILGTVPDKIDIGPIYDRPLALKNTSTQPLKAEEKELVFDIDLTDYDSSRKCGCKDTLVCKQCWSYVQCAMKVLEDLMVNVFGAKNRLWVFSGRRGAHCWICDDSFRKLKFEARSAIADFVTVYQGNEKNKSKQLKLYTRSPHPSFSVTSPIFATCESFFVNLYLEEWDIVSKNPGM